MTGSWGKTSMPAPPRRPEAERLDQRLLVDHVAAGGVDQAGAGPHGGEGLAADEAQGLGRRGQVEGDEVARAVEVLGARGHLDAQLAVARLGHEGVEGDHPHPEPLGPLGHHLADAAEAQDAERLAGHLDAGEARALPAPVDEAGVGLGDVACLRKQQGDGVLGRREGVRAGGVHDHDAAAGGGVHVDVVDAGPGPAHHLQAPGPLDHVGGDLGGAAHHQGVVVADAVHQLVAREADAAVDREALRQVGDAGVRDRLADQDAQVGSGERAQAHRAGSASAATRWAAAIPAPGSTGWSESDEHDLQGAEHRDDVAVVVVAAVADAADLPRELALAAGDLDAEAALQVALDRVALDALGDQERRDDVGLGVLGAEQRQPARLHAGAGHAAERAVAGEDLLQPLGLDQAQGLLQLADQRDRRRERAARAALAGALPVEVEAARPERGGARDRTLARGHEGQPRRRHQALLRARDDDVDPPPVHGQVDHPEPRDCVGHQDAVAGRLAQRGEVGDRAGGRLALGDEHDLDAGLPAQRVGDGGRVDRPAPLALEVQRVDAVVGADGRPAVAEVAARGHQHALAPGGEVGDGRVHGAGARGAEDQHLALGLEDAAQALDDVLPDRDELGRARVEDRAGAGGDDLGGQDGGPRGHQGRT